MIITKTPLRISLVGGGTDLPAFASKHGGAVVSFTIDKYIYIHVNKPFENKVRVSYSETENVLLAREVSHQLVRNCLNYMGITHRIEIVSVSDIPGRGSGLGSSSAYTVGLLNALVQHCILHQIPNANHYEDKVFDLAESAAHVEIDMSVKEIGKQDHYACTYGGLNHFIFNKDGTVVVKRVPMKEGHLEELNNRLLLFWTGKVRKSSDVLIAQSKNIRTEDNTVYLMEKMRDMAVELNQELTLGNLRAVGELLHKNWTFKRQLAEEITSPEIDEWYKTARENGAVGGKLCGAGGGGFMLFYAPQMHHKRIADKLPLRQVPFKITEKGSRLVYMEGFND